jgi:hypothetical protein
MHLWDDLCHNGAIIPFLQGGSELIGEALQAFVAK